MRLPAALLSVALLAAACGSDEVADPGGSDSTLPSVTAPPDEPLGAGPYPVATLDVTITHPDVDDVSYTISCLGDTATVTGDVAVGDRAACEALADDEVRTRLIEGPPDDQVCTEIYGGPDVATIVGTYDEEAVDTTVDRTNGCGIDRWDRLLADVLPPATGAIEPGS